MKYPKPRAKYAPPLSSFSSKIDSESLAAPGAFAGTAAVRCDVAAPAITGAKLLKTALKMGLSLGDNFRLRQKS